MTISTFLCLAFLCLTAFPQNTNQLKSDINYLLKTSGEYFISPVNFSNNDYLKLGVLTSSITLISTLDDDVKTFSQKHFDSANVILRNFDSYYHIEFMSAYIIGSYIYSSINNNVEFRKLSLRLLTSGLLTGITTFGIKSIIGRSRPYKSHSQYEINWFEIDDKFLSFPSGHTSLAFSFSTIMAEQNNNFLWKSFWFSAASLVGIARIYNNKHWFSDVVMGAVIGYLTAKFVLNFDEENSLNSLNLQSNRILFFIPL